MSKWKTVRLGDVCEKGASNITQNEIVDNFGEYPIYGAAGFIKNVDFYKQEEAYIGIVKDGAGVGRISIHPAKSSLIGTMQYIFPNENIDIKFLASFLKYQNLGRFYTGATIPHIYFKDYKNIKLKLPPLETQKQIAAVLDKCTSLISKYKKILEKYDTLIKSRFIEMFGDPVQNPMGWEVKKLGDICTKISDGVHAKPEYTATGKPFISVVNINSGKLLFDDCKYVSEEAYEKMIKSTHPEKGDVLYTKVGATYGIPALVDTDRAFCLYVSVALLKPKSEIVNSQFLTTSMAQPYIKNQADKRIKGIGVPDLHLNQIREFEVLVPPLELQNQFNSFVQQIDKSKFAVQKSLEKAETLYKSLMQEYFG